MNRYFRAVVLAMGSLAVAPIAAQAESVSSESTRIRWDIAPGFAAASVGGFNYSGSLTLAYDNADRRVSYRFVQYGDSSIFNDNEFFSLDLFGDTPYLRSRELLYGWLHTSEALRLSLQSGIGHFDTNRNFGELGKVSGLTIPIVAGMVVGDARYMRFKLEAEYVLNQARPYFGVFLGVMLGSVW